MERNWWRLFARHHYLTSELPMNAKTYIGFVDGRPAAFVSANRFPHGSIKNFIQISRIVTLPDFQGIGIASITIDAVADYYNQKKQRVIITTSHPGMIRSLNKNEKWNLTHQGRYKKHTGLLKKCGSQNRITTSWEYIRKTI